MSDSLVLKRGLAQMLKGGVIMDVVNVEEAIIAERAGAVAVMALERVPSDIRKQGGIARMSDPEMILQEYMLKEEDGEFVQNFFSKYGKNKK